MKINPVASKVSSIRSVAATSTILWPAKLRQGRARKEATKGKERGNESFRPRRPRVGVEAVLFPAAVEKCQAADEAFGGYLSLAKSLAKLVLQLVGR